MRCGARRSWPAWCVVLGGAARAAARALRGDRSRLGRACPSACGSHPPGTGGLPTLGARRRRWSCLVGVAAARARPRARRAGADLGLRAARRARARTGRAAGFTKPVRLVLESLLRPEREIAVRDQGGIVQSVSLPRARAAPDRGARLRAARGRCAARQPAGRGRLQSGRLRRLCAVPRRPAGGAAGARAAGAARMTARDALAGAIQVCGTVLLAPLLPGLTQWTKARLQGRRGRSPLQPYRELARLWRKSGVDPEGTGPVYRFAPAIVAAVLALAGLLVPVAGHAPGWPRRARRAGAARPARARALRAGARPPGTPANGFALQGASRDLAISVGGRGRCCVLALACAALAGRRRPTCAAMAAASAGAGVWSSPRSGARAARVRARHRRRDRPAAGRQPRHPSRADDDPRRAAARVRRPRPRAPAVGHGGAPLADARARGGDLPAAPRRRSAPASRCCPSASVGARAVGLGAARDAAWRSCASCSSRACSAPAPPSPCSAVVSALVESAP